VAFDSDQAGTVITCPHCGLDTALYVPTGHAAPPGLPAQRRQRRLRIAFFVTLVLVLAAGIGYGAYRYGAAVLTTSAPIVGSTLAAVLSLVVAVLLFLLAVLWIIFPVFVYFRLDRMITLLRAIEANTRRR
jgi:hypothetical protein